MLTTLIWFGVFTVFVFILFCMFGDTFCGKATYAFVRMVLCLLILTFCACITQLRGDSFNWFNAMVLGLYGTNIILDLITLIKIKFTKLTLIKITFNSSI